MRRIFSRDGDAAGYSRAAAIDPAIDRETGEFEMIMASEGEAADGHIVSIRGVELIDEVPLQLDHDRRASANLGTVTNLRTDRKDGVPILRGVGRIRLTGEGAPLEVRRDLVDGIAEGAIRSVSMTWEALEVIERRELPSNHPAFVKHNDPNARRRWGLFFKRSRPLEQSIVGVGADRAALVGRAESATSDDVRAVWQTLVERIDAPARSREAEIIEALESRLAEIEERLSRAAEHDSRDDPRDNPPEWTDAFRALERRIEADGRRGLDEFTEAIEEIGRRMGVST